MPPHKIVAWVRRKLGPEVLVLRYRADGSLGCAAPCVMCARELNRFDLRVHCPDASGQWFSGRLSDSGAPPQLLTSGQRRMLNRGFRRPGGRGGIAHTAAHAATHAVTHAVRTGQVCASQALQHAPAPLLQHHTRLLALAPAIREAHHAPVLL